MKNFKAISMDCNEEQFETIKEELIELGCNVEGCNFFKDRSILVNNCGGGEMQIVNTCSNLKRSYNRTYIGAFDKEAFLQACGKVEEVEEVYKSGWYAYQGTKYLMYHNIEKEKKFGFSTIGEWYGETDMSNTDYLMKEFVKVDNEEVLKRLTEEAKRRGFKVGYSSGKYLYSITEKDFIFDSDKNNLYVRQKGDAFNLIMQNGIWADIIKNEEPKIESYDVEKQLDKKLDSMTKSRNQYKYLYEKEKAKRIDLESDNKKPKIVIESNPLNNGNGKVYHDMIEKFKEEKEEKLRIYNVINAKNIEINKLKNDIDSIKNYNETYYYTYKRRLEISNDRISELSKHNKELLFKKDSLEKEVEESIKETNTYKIAILILILITLIILKILS